ITILKPALSNFVQDRDLFGIGRPQLRSWFKRSHLCSWFKRRLKRPQLWNWFKRPARLRQTLFLLLLGNPFKPKNFALQELTTGGMQVDHRVHDADEALWGGHPRLIKIFGGNLPTSQA